MDPKERVGKVVRKHLEGSSLRRLASDWGVSHDAIRAWAEEERFPDSEYLQIISRKTGYSVDYFLHGKRSAQPYMIANEAIQQIDTTEELFRLQEQIMFRIKENLGQYNLAS